VDAPGLVVGAFASGAFEGLHAAKKNSGKTTAVVRMNRLIKLVACGVSRIVSFRQLASQRVVNKLRLAVAYQQLEL
jgi:hypothetical protein